MAQSEPAFRLRDLIDASPAIISIIDPGTWRICYQNRSGIEQVGDLRGKTCYQAIAKNPAVCGFCRAQEAIQTGRVTASEVPVPADGRWLLVQWAPVRAIDQRVFAMETITDITDLKRREAEARALKERFEWMATHDALSGLLNRHGWIDQAGRILRRAARDQAAVGVLLADLDHFKRVNDTWGHAAGDQVLREAGRRLAAACRPGDLVGRWGGEEFIVMLSPPVAALGPIADRLVRAFADEPFANIPQAGALPVTISVGGAGAIPQRGDRAELEHLLQQADRLLFEAKARGRNRAVCQDQDGGMRSPA